MPYQAYLSSLLCYVDRASYIQVSLPLHYNSVALFCARNDQDELFICVVKQTLNLTHLSHRQNLRFRRSFLKVSIDLARFCGEGLNDLRPLAQQQPDPRIRYVWSVVTMLRTFLHLSCAHSCTLAAPSFVCDVRPGLNRFRPKPPPSPDSHSLTSSSERVRSESLASRGTAELSSATGGASLAVSRMAQGPDLEPNLQGRDTGQQCGPIQESRRQKGLWGSWITLEPLPGTEGSRTQQGTPFPLLKEIPAEALQPRMPQWVSTRQPVYATQCV